MILQFIFRGLSRYFSNKFRISDISINTKQFNVARNMPHKIFNHFVPVETRPIMHSNNPKTVLNRSYNLVKQGIELSDHRDDSAFRTAKSRALRKLRTSDRWPMLSPAEQQDIEEAVIQELVSQREAKKRAHES